MTCIDYLSQLLARREYTVRELTQKAQAKGFNLQEITDAIQALQQQNYQSDTRFIESAITSYRGKYGKSVIKRKCLAKGITADIFDRVWASQTEGEELEELDNLKAKVMRQYKISDFSSIDRKTKAKLWNYLQYRGFNPYQVLEQWQAEKYDE